MAKQPAMPESLEEMPFPQNGLNLVNEFESQPQGTTPIGTNVRAYEPLTQRNRGGARPGLTEYINSTVLGFPSKIQHLNIIVDPTTDALLIDDPIDGIDDPSTNNKSLRNPPPPRKVRRGGSARQPNRNKKRPPATIVLVQKAQGDFSGTTLPNPVKAGNLIVVVCDMSSSNGTLGSNATGTPTITDTLLNNYSAAGPDNTFGGPFTWFVGGVDQGPYNAGFTLAIRFAVANASGIVTVSGTADDIGGGTLLYVLEFAGATLTFDGANQNTVTETVMSQPDPGAITTNTIPVSGTGELVIAYFSPVINPQSLPAGFVIDFGATLADSNFLLVHKSGVTGSIPVAGTGGASPTGETFGQYGPAFADASGNLVFAWQAVGASFRGI